MGTGYVHLSSVERRVPGAPFMRPYRMSGHRAKRDLRRNPEEAIHRWVPHLRDNLIVAKVSIRAQRARTVFSPHTQATATVSQAPNKKSWCPDRTPAQIIFMKRKQY